MEVSSGCCISAVHRALTNALLLENIFSFIASDKYGVWQECLDRKVGHALTEGDDLKCVRYGKRGVIYRCAQVNRLWFHEAIPYMWKELEKFGDTLITLMEKLDPHRRQFYANFIEQGSELAYHPSHDLHHIVQDVIFSRLRSLHILIYNDCHLTQIRHCRLEELTLDPYHEYDDPVERWVNQDTTAAVLDQIAEFYPNVRVIKFVDRALVGAGVLEKFRERMPKLDTFDHDLLMVREKTL